MMATAGRHTPEGLAEDNPYSVDAAERRLLHEALQHTKGNKQAAARAMGISVGHSIG